MVLSEMAVTMGRIAKIGSFAPGLVGFRATATRFMNIFVFFLLATRGGNGNTTVGGNGNTTRAQRQDLNPLSLERKNYQIS